MSHHFALLIRLCRAAFWLAALAAALALVMPGVQAAWWTGLSVLAVATALGLWRAAVAVRRREPPLDDETLPPVRLDSVTLLPSAARICREADEAADFSAALRAVAHVLKVELGAREAHSYILRTLEPQHALLDEQLDNAVGPQPVTRRVALDHSALAEAIRTRRPSGAGHRNLAVPVGTGDGDDLALLELEELSIEIEPTALDALLEVATRQLRAAAQRWRLQTAQRRLRELADCIDDGVFISNPQRTQFEFLAGDAFDVWGMTREQQRERSNVFFDNVIAEDRTIVEDRMRRELRGEGADIRFRIDHPQRGRRWLRSRTRTMAQSDGSLRVYGRVSDVTEEHERALELERTRDAAEAARQSKSRFMATLSHELRTPMIGILGMTELLLDTPLDERQRRHALTVQESADALHGLIDDLLDFARIDAGSVELIEAPFHLADVRDGLLCAFGPRAQAKGLSIAFELDPELPRQVLGDAKRLAMVLSKLIDNAVRFTDHGGVTVTVDRVRGEGRVSFSVRDTGQGMADDVKARLFVPFTQAGGNLDRPHGGLGLGLAIAERLVALMGGTLRAQSLAAVGSQFDFAVALPPAADAIGSVAADVEVTPGTLSAGPPRILVVEDNEVNQRVTAEMLRRLGCNVQLAGSAEEGLQAMGEVRFDMVLMDIQMPGMDGMQALRRIRDAAPQRAATPPVVAVTAHAFEGDARHFMEIGFDGYLPKPFRQNQLLAMLKHHLPTFAPVPLDEAPPSGAGSAVLDADALARLRELDPTGANQLMKRVLHAFETSAARLMPQLRDARTRGDRSGIRHVTHTLKSSSASIGGLALSHMCAEIETAIRLDKPDDLGPRLDAMEAEMQRVLLAIKPLVGDAA
jgi:signal transduction histidine kinase/DNA-binding NarL/FixJ family response regulator